MKKLRRKNEELNSEKAIVERQRDELEEQRDQLLDATTKAEDPADEEGPADGMADMPRNEFLEHFMECIDQRFTDSDLTVGRHRPRYVPVARAALSPRESRHRKDAR